MSEQIRLSAEEVGQRILSGIAKSFGFHLAYFADIPDAAPLVRGWFDLIQDSQSARVDDGVLFMELWFTDYNGSLTMLSAALERRSVSSPVGMIEQVKLRIAVELTDIEYLNIGGQRYWLDWGGLLDYDPGVEAIRQAVEEWEAAWTHYMEKLRRLDELKAAGRYGYQLRQPLKAIGLAAERLRALDPEFCQRIGIV